MTYLVTLDASLAIGFYNGGILDFLLDFCDQSDFRIIICEENYRECNNRPLRRALTDSDVVDIRPSNDTLKDDIKRECVGARRKPVIQDNDYRAIATSIDSGSIILGSDDFNLNVRAQQYLDLHGKIFQVLTSPTLLHFIHVNNKILSPWDDSIIKTLRYFRQIEIERVYQDFQADWGIQDVRKRFLPYEESIIQTVDTVCGR